MMSYGILFSAYRAREPFDSPLPYEFLYYFLRIYGYLVDFFPLFFIVITVLFAPKTVIFSIVSSQFSAILLAVFPHIFVAICKHSYELLYRLLLLSASMRCA